MGVNFNFVSVKRSSLTSGLWRIGGGQVEKMMNSKDVITEEETKLQMMGRGSFQEIVRHSLCVVLMRKTPGYSVFCSLQFIITRQR